MAASQCGTQLPEGLRAAGMAHDQVVLDMEAFKNVWESRKWTADESVKIYIDNPFCLKKCRFCIHGSNLAAPTSDTYKRYYFDYLPGQLDSFSSIIRNSQVTAVYFGGGTASLMTPSVMRLIFEAIPGFHDIPVKFFESNPASLDKEKMDSLIRYGFTYVSMGVQSLDKDLCILHNRIPISQEKLAKKVAHLQANGVHVNCDLLAFMRTGTVNDLDDLASDLLILENAVKPEVISIYPMYQRISARIASNGTQFYVDDEADHNYTLISNLRKKLMLFCSASEMYRPVSDNVENLDRKALLANSRIDYTLSSLPAPEQTFMNAYNSSAYPRHSAEQNVLAFGGYGERMPYSYIGKTCYFMHVNLMWNSYYILQR